MSYANDGTEVERKVQRAIVSRASKFIQKSLKNHIPGLPDLVITIPIIVTPSYERPIVPVQDSKHGAKTARNNLFSGARFLTLGTKEAHFGQMMEIHSTKGSPLYRRDVIKVDRQDDRAAERLFSAPTLSFVVKNHTQHLGVIVYLFIFGEVIDAWQSRKIGHRERLLMVLRAHYFLMLWRTSLRKTGYAEATHFISREAFDIFTYLINGLISLILVYRDHLPTGKHALMPWLHSSEPCEHVFAEFRKRIKDFSFMEMIHMIPKVRVLLNSAVAATSADKPNGYAMGYMHMYFLAHDIDFGVLADFPMDYEIELISQKACGEAKSLAWLVECDRSILANAATIPGHLTLPSMRTIPAQEDPLRPTPNTLSQNDMDELDDSDSDGDFSDSDSNLDILEGEVLDEAIKAFGQAPLLDSWAEQKMMGLIYPAVSLSLNNMNDMYVFTATHSRLLLSS